MIKLNILRLAICICLLFASGGIAIGDCADDGNNDTTTAIALGFQQVASETVCPDDPFDYYRLEVSANQTVSGTIKLESNQTGTEFKLSAYNGGLSHVWSTTDSLKEKTILIQPGQLPEDTYYLRVTYYSNYPVDHDYMITTDLETGGLKIKLNPDLIHFMFTDDSPWLSGRGNARNTGRSTFQGPPAAANLSYLKVLSPMVTQHSDVYRYHGLTVGPGNHIRFVEESSQQIYRDNPDSELRSIVVKHRGERSPVFDSKGNFYTLEREDLGRSPTYLVSYLSFPTDERWRASLPAGKKAIVAVGSRIYVRIRHDFDNLVVFTTAGEELYNISFPSPIVGVAEDRTRSEFFVQTLTNLYKFDFTSNLMWDRGLTYLTMNMGPVTAWESNGPMVNHDGRVRIEYLGEWVVFNQDGSTYKEKPEQAPISSEMFDLTFSGIYPTGDVALGSNGKFFRLYSGLSNGSSRIICFEDWDYPTWGTTLDDSVITDIVLDLDNTIYVCYRYKDSNNVYSFRWSSINPDDGSIIFTQTETGVPESLCGMFLSAELAIGENRNLVLLHEGGFIGVYSPPRLLPGKYNFDIMK